MRIKFLARVCALLLGLTFAYQVAEAEEGQTKVTFSGSNFFEARTGMKEPFEGNVDNEHFFNDGEYRIHPWYYVKDLLDMNIGINKFFFRGRFQVDEPTMGYHPEYIQWYREFMALRTFGFDGDIFNGEVGHFKTVFGRGLTISLKEDPLVELSNLLDGVYLHSELPFGTIKGFAGRHIEDQNMGFFGDTGLTELEDVNTLFENFQFRDNIYGAHAEIFPFSYIPPLEMFSASSLGGGLLLYRREVSKLYDTTMIGTVNNNTTLVYYQPRTNILVPSWLLNLSVGEVNLYGEFARGIANVYDLVDTLTKEEIVEKKKNYAAFVEISGAIGDFYLRGEYKNYFYEYDKGEGIGNTLVAETMAKYTDAPWARFKHLWHLLAKHTLIPYVQNDLGYNTEVTWTPSDRTQILLTSSFGGKHEYNESDSSKFSQFKFQTGEIGSYYDIYVEFNKKIGEKIDLKIGADYGQMDWKAPDILYRTLAGSLIFGPFNEKHTFGFQAEAQLNSFSHYAEDNYEEVKARVMENIPEQVPDEVVNSSNLKDFQKYYRRLKSLDKEVRTEQKPLGFNGLGEISYSFTSKFKMSCLLELETHVGDPEIELYVVDDIVSKSRLFFNGGLSWTPVPKHTFFLEGGSFSRKKICNMGVCTVIPAFRGIVFTIKSIL